MKIFHRFPQTGIPSVRPLRNSRSGIALVVTLSIVVLLTFLVIAFLSKVQRARHVESASAAGSEAVELARSGAERVIADLEQEIVDHSSPKLNGFSPEGPHVLVPERDSNVAAGSTLIKQSRGGSTTDVESANHRVVPAARWWKPELFEPDYNPDVPQWIDLTLDGISESAAPGALIGRFAYNVYDISGLVEPVSMGTDAGVRYDEGTSIDREIPFKGYPYHVSFSDVPEFKDNMGVSSFNSWKLHSGTKTQMRDTFTYVEYEPNEWRQLLESWSETGGMVAPSVAKTKMNAEVFTNYLLGRQDMITMAQTKHPDNAGLKLEVLPYVTTFLRSKNAPSLPYIDATTLGFADANRFTATYGSAQTIRFYRDDPDHRDADGALDNTYEVEVRAGDPVLQRQFSLGKLGRIFNLNDPDNPTYSYWLTANGPGTDVSASAIRDVFGLGWDASNSRWIYTGAGTSGLTPATEIRTLAQVGAEGRAPDFFELLKAGINEDSLGGVQTQDGALSLSAVDDIHENRDLHILRIGASIIDQADDNNYPTVIGFDVGSATIGVSGVEDLPYLQGAAAVYDTSESNHRIAIVPILYNPHRQPEAEPTTPVRVRIEAGSVSFSNGTTVSGQSQEINIDKTEVRQRPATANGDPVLTDANALIIDVPAPKMATTTVTLSDLTFVLEYRGASGNWIPYDSLWGTGVTTGELELTNVEASEQDSQFKVPREDSTLVLRPDPRTGRYGMFAARSAANFVGAAEHTITGKPVANSASKLSIEEFSKGGLSEESGDLIVNILDRPQDSEPSPRPNDGKYGASLVPSDESSPQRPMILQRPIRNAGELGFAFRDQPWKSVNFFTEESADVALIDLFQPSEVIPNGVAGRVNLNAATEPTIAAVFNRTGKRLGPDSIAYTDTLSVDAAQDLAASFKSSFENQVSPSQALAQALSGAVQGEVEARFGDIKWEREGLARALAGSVQTRTWNVLIDVIAQSGLYPPSAGGAPSEFVVQGEARYWVSLALDRFTGETVDIQWEKVLE